MFPTIIVLELSNFEISTIICSLLSSAHLDAVSEIDSFGLVLKLQASLTVPSSSLGFQTSTHTAINAIQPIQDQYVVCADTCLKFLLINCHCYRVQFFLLLLISAQLMLPYASLFK